MYSQLMLEERIKILSQLPPIHSRRKFLLGSSAVSLASFLPEALDAQVATPQKAEANSPVTAVVPRDTILKFNSDGSRRPFAGNTVICHLPQQCRVRDAITALGDSLRTSSFASKLSVLPGESYHMTVFPGPNDQGRAMYGWPADIPINVPMSECNRIIGERIKNFRMRGDLPIRVRVDRERMLGSLHISPADDRENAKLRTLRDRLATEVFRFRDIDHDNYTFHVTLAYQLNQLTRDEEREHQALLERYFPAILDAAPIIELGVPEFCTFEDMFRFEIRSLLRT
jgi:hypothetical protein